MSEVLYKNLHRVAGHSVHLVIPKWWVHANGTEVRLEIDKNRIVVTPTRGKRRRGGA